MRFRALLLATFALLPLAAAAEDAPPPSSPAQRALFETPHLASIRAPQELDYAFRREEEGKPAVEDRITMDVRTAEADGRHDVYPEFLSGERRIGYPPALGFHGNPLLMYVLDRDTRELAAATGGSTMWFRMRIRAALAQRATLRDLPAGDATGAGPATEVAITPFEGEARAKRYQQRRYVFTLAEAVPGGIAEIRTILPGGDGPAGAEPTVTETVSFAGVRQP